MFIVAGMEKADCIPSYSRISRVQPGSYTGKLSPVSSATGSVGAERLDDCASAPWAEARVTPPVSTKYTHYTLCVKVRDTE